MGTAAPAPFDWKSLITPAVTLGMKGIGDAVAPDPSLINARTNATNSQVSNQVALAKMANANRIRSSIMPGMYTSLGFTPSQGQAMTGNYTANEANPAAMPGAAPASGSPSLGGTLGKTALGVGAAVAPSLIKAGIGTAATATTAATGLGGIGGLGSAIAGLATNPFTIAGAGVLATGLLWKKSQVHPTADKWVQGEQAPFDASMAKIDQQNLPPDQAQAAKTTNAQNYLNELVKFAGQGSKQAIVAKQAAATFRQYYGDPMKYGIQLPF